MTDGETALAVRCRQFPELVSVVHICSSNNRGPEGSQQEVLLTAVEAGYYRAPRESTLGDVAETLGVANATCSDVLHRAEGHVIHWFVEEHVDA